MKLHNILTDLTSISPIISDRIDELIHAPVSEDDDSGVLTPDRLIDEAATMLIELLEENGIIIHYDPIGDIISDRFNLNHIIRLYTHFLPDKVGMLLRQSSTGLREILSGMEDVSDNEFIIKLLEVVAPIGRPYLDMSVYLMDKIKSTSKYAHDARQAIEQEAFNYENDFLIPSEVSDFIIRIVDEKRWFADRLKFLSNKGIIAISDETITKMKNDYLRCYSDPRNALLLSHYQALSETNGAVMLAFIDNIHQESDCHIEHYDKSKIEFLPKETIAAMILAKFSDQRLLGIEPAFDLLTKLSQPSVDIQEIIRNLPVQNSLK